MSTLSLIQADPDIKAMYEDRISMAQAVAVRQMIATAEKDELRKIGLAIADDVKKGLEWTKMDTQLETTRLKYGMRQVELENGDE